MSFRKNINTLEIYTTAKSKNINYLNEIIDIPYSGSYLSTSPNTISKVPEKKVNINFVLICKELHFHVT